MKIAVDNIKCGGCADTITKKLTTTFDTENIDINLEQGVINLDVDEVKKDEVVKVLLNLGYPEINSIYGFRSAKAKVKSFVSCAIGKMNI
ncbi:heavy metal transport/detoxification protein [Candidatus Ruthia magnifica str. Cm (Calyptogena magnifica)]|uniref:Heavy metal transport/detoxification protein n=1 Tax=Ruthia magnifica subsp. Calyptogena magnifica TaxID=413404 RepID=A1AXD6_RUTMC|nr:heavy-metal-associated domain-containing protein [Candidatus Ruthturnera calyptogenae]ABL02593.1 heavy metal transport/detoxification protein [Candidatus Ruthia magnifica str. Cm (Calyptogena magnifica)]